jgi:hypothetical protein
VAVHATREQLADFVSGSVPVPADVEAARLLARASELVDSYVRAAYATDQAGAPTDAAVLAAHRDATCAQVERWLVDGTDDADITGPAAQETIGRHSHTPSPSAMAELCPRARRILRVAGLAGGRVQ